MKCPYCLDNFYENWKYFEYSDTIQPLEYAFLLKEDDKLFSLRYCYCPSCKKMIIQIGSIKIAVFESIKRTLANIQPQNIYNYQKWFMLKPNSISRAPLPNEVPQEFVEDYIEACLVLPESPKASAALSRRCLQNLLIEKAGAKGDNLSQQIQYVLDSKELPSYLANGLDAVRNIGNFSAHPIKSKSSGEIVKVDPGEAEWNLDILEDLFDFYFVRPSIYAKKKEALNKKLIDSGKPPLKEA